MPQLTPKILTEQEKNLLRTNSIQPGTHVVIYQNEIIIGTGDTESKAYGMAMKWINSDKDRNLKFIKSVLAPKNLYDIDADKKNDGDNNNNNNNNNDDSSAFNSPFKI